MSTQETIITENLDQCQLIAERTFNGPIELVWRAWTEPEILDQWWAPLPWKAETRHMDFKEGGYWLYCMKGPNGEQHWGRANYRKIATHQFFDANDVFCDEEGNANTDLPGTDWHVLFTPGEQVTTVRITTTFDSQEAMKELIKMGVREGMKMAHANLDRVLQLNAATDR